MQAMLPIVFEYAGNARGPYQYGGEIDDDAVLIRFQNLYDLTRPGVSLWAYPADTLIRDFSTFDAFAEWQAEIDRPATMLEAGDFGWAAHQDLPNETATYYQMSDDGSLHYKLTFESGGAFSDRTDPLDTAETYAAAAAMHTVLCG